jgi:hypothetical protein
LFEQGEQHHGNHHPDGNFGKPRVIQERLQSKKLTVTILGLPAALAIPFQRFGPLKAGN